MRLLSALLFTALFLNLIVCRFPTSPFARSDIEKIKALHSSDIVESTMKMKIDHFNANGESEEYDMRYLVNNKHLKKNGPIFFYAGNEGDIYTFYNNTGFMVNTLAKEFGASVVFAEHRYFGESMPFGKDSFKTANLKYLNVEQVMSDYVEFIKQYRDEHATETTPVIVFGGSYGGMLASWLRMKFPETFQGAIAASAPIIYFKGAVPEDGFYQVIDKVFTQGHEECHTNIKAVHSLLVDMKNDPAKIKELQSTFNTCQKTTKSADVDKVIALLDNAWIYMAMTNYPYPTDFLSPMPGWPVDESCKPFNFTMKEKDSTLMHLLKGDESVFTEDEQKLLNAAFESITVYYNYTGSLECNDLDGDGSGNLDAFGWNILACNEMVMPMSATNQSMFLPFEFDYEEYAAYCHEQFGVSPQYDFALTYFGGRHITKDFMYASNIVFSNGDIDPWSAGSVTKDVGKGTVVVNIENSAHHLDLRDPNPEDPQSVIDARNIEREEIAKWLKEYEAE